MHDKNSYEEFFETMLVHSYLPNITLPTRLHWLHRLHRLHQCKNMRVVRAQELFRQTELLGRVNPEHNISDHSMLVWDFQLSVDEYTDGGEFGTHFPSVLITKYDINEVPELFMCDDDAVQNVNSIFDEPDGEIAIENMNDVYSKFCHEVH